MKMLAKLRGLIHRVYEKGVYKINPCDVDSAWFASPVGRGLSRLAVECQCCNGARIFAAAALGVLLPQPFGYAFLGVLVGLATVHSVLYSLTKKEVPEWPESVLDYAEAAKAAGTRPPLLREDQSFEGVVKLLQRGLDESAFGEQYGRTEELRRKAAITNMEIEAALGVLASADHTRATARDALLSRPMGLE